MPEAIEQNKNAKISLEENNKPQVIVDFPIIDQDNGGKIESIPSPEEKKGNAIIDPPAEESKGNTIVDPPAEENKGTTIVDPLPEEKKDTIVEASSEIIDYSYKFDRELVNFNDGYEIKTKVDKELILVQYSSDSPNASLSYWTTVDEANGMESIEDVMNKLALSKDWGSRNTIKVARIPAGTEVKYAVGTAKEQSLIADPRTGGGEQYLFNEFDTKWITEIRNIP